MAFFNSPVRISFKKAFICSKYSLREVSTGRLVFISFRFGKFSILFKNCSFRNSFLTTGNKNSTAADSDEKGVIQKRFSFSWGKNSESMARRKHPSRGKRYRLKGIFFENSVLAIEIIDSFNTNILNDKIRKILPFHKPVLKPFSFRSINLNGEYEEPVLKRFELLKKGFFIASSQGNFFVINKNTFSIKGYKSL